MDARIFIGSMLSSVFFAGVTLRAGSLTNTPTATVSSSRQFFALTTEPSWSSVMCVFADQIKRQWRERLDIQTDNWRDPILLRLSERAVTNGVAAWLEIARTDLHLQFQVELRIPPPLERERVTSLIVWALCAEYANRERTVPRKGVFEPAHVPFWLVEGLAQSLVGSRDELLFGARRWSHSLRPPMAEELITTAAMPADETERHRFQVASWVLTESLLLLPNGADKLCRLLREATTPANALRAFESVYSLDFPKPVVREKWWSLQLLQRGAAMVPQDFTAAVTARQLSSILDTKLDVSRGEQEGQAVVPVTELFRYADASWFSQAVLDRLAQLLLLRAAAHPLYQPVIDRYLVGLQWLAEQKISRGRGEIARAEKLRVQVEHQTRAIREYLDQTERTYSPADTVSLGQQLRLLSESDELELLHRDPISDYLNKFDR